MFACKRCARALTQSSLFSATFGPVLREKSEDDNDLALGKQRLCHEEVQQVAPGRRDRLNSYREMSELVITLAGAKCVKPALVTDGDVALGPFLRLAR